MLGLFILPGHTVTFTFSLEGVIASLKAGRTSEIKYHEVLFYFTPGSYTPMIISYEYQVLPGGLSVVDNQVDFSPGFVGMQQIQEVRLNPSATLRS